MDVDKIYLEAYVQGNMHYALQAVARAAREEMQKKCAKVCEKKGKYWQSLRPDIISPVACAAADCADAIRAITFDDETR